MEKYTKAFKLSIIKRMMPSSNEKVSNISKETGFVEQTLFK